jgi:hypothetical protein
MLLPRVEFNRIDQRDLEAVISPQRREERREEEQEHLTKVRARRLIGD